MTQQSFGGRRTLAMARAMVRRRGLDAPYDYDQDSPRRGGLLAVLVRSTSRINPAVKIDGASFMLEIIFIVEESPEGGVYREGAGNIDLYRGRRLGRAPGQRARCRELSLRRGQGSQGRPSPLRPRGSPHPMKLPRDLSGEQLAHALARLGYQVTRQTGAHLRLTTTRIPSGSAGDGADSLPRVHDRGAGLVTRDPHPSPRSRLSSASS